MNAMPHLCVYDENLIRLGYVDSPQSFLWIRRYFTSGEFEIHAPASEENLRLLKPLRFLKPSHSEEAAILYSVEIQKNEDDTEMITAKGPFLTGHLASRVVWNEDNTLAGLVRLNCISPPAAEAARKLPGLEMGTVQAVSYPAGGWKGKPLTVPLEALAKANNLGLRIIMDERARKFVFETYSGLDRSQGQQKNPRVRFSPKWGNLAECSYLSDWEGGATFVYGQAVNGESVYQSQTLDKSASPLARFETFLSIPAQRNGSSVDSSATAQKLKEACEDALDGPAVSLSAQASIDSGYRRKWDLGDVVTVLHERWGVQEDFRVYEVEEDFDETGYTAAPSFGSPQKTILDILKKRG